MRPVRPPALYWYTLLFQAEMKEAEERLSELLRFSEWEQ